MPDLTANMDRILAKCCTDYEIIIVDDGSLDGTPDIAGKLKDAFPKLRYFRHERNRGVGAAFGTGVGAAQYEWIGYTDGDAQYDAQDILNFVKYMNESDVITGTRVYRADGMHRKWISVIYNIILKCAFGLSIKDTNSALKIYRRKALQAAFPLISEGPFYDAEVLIKIQNADFKITEVPIRHLPRKYGAALGVSFSSIQNTARCMVKNEFRPYVIPGFISYGILKILSLAGTFLGFRK
ncbi:glycosyltransferase family 2 protein [bacterium]|nr:glycosyltransferase family 2 protein [bacterium]